MTVTIDRPCSLLCLRHSACSSRDLSFAQALISASTAFDGPSLSFSIFVMRFFSSRFSQLRTCEMILSRCQQRVSSMHNLAHSYCCNKFIPSSAPDERPIQFVTALTLTFASTILMTPLIMVATLPTFSVWRTTLYGSIPCTLPIMRSRVGPSGDSTSV